MENENLTAAQREVLDFIRERMATSGLPPTYREIQQHFGYKSIGSVQDHLKALKKKGALKEIARTKTRQRARGMLPSDHTPPEELRQLSIYGEIAAGATRDSEQIELGKLTVPAHQAKGSAFALRVVGTSMIDAGILEGDVLIVEKEVRVKSGDIVVALVDGETTVKRYRVKNGVPWLIPENARMKPIPVEGRDFRIQGKVVGLQRRWE